MGEGDKEGGKLLGFRPTRASMDVFKRRMCFVVELPFQLGPHCYQAPHLPSNLPWLTI